MQTFQQLITTIFGSNNHRKMALHPIIYVLIYPCYLVYRLLFHLLRDAIWCFNGTRYRLHKNAASLEPRAHVLDIVARYKYDTLMQSNKIEDFVLTHTGFEDPKYILRDEVSLYTINESECVFVECHSGNSVWDLDDYSYSRDAQFRKAIRVLTLPTDAVFRLAETMERPKNVIILGNTSRCGSTLLCRILQDTGHFTCYTDPGAISDLMPLIGSECDDSSKRLIHATLTLLCKPRTSDLLRGHVVKVMANSTEVLLCLYQVFPELQYMFLYRNHLSVLKSLARYTPSRPYELMLKLLGKLSNSYAERLNEYHFNANKLNVCNLENESGTDSKYSSVIYQSITPIGIYYKLHLAGVDIYAIRFEDIIQDPEAALRRLFLLWDIPVNMLPRALRVLDRDAQDKSPLPSKQITKLKIPPFTKEDEDKVNAVCIWLGIPNVLNNKVLPGTITRSGDDI